MDRKPQQGSYIQVASSLGTTSRRAMCGIALASGARGGEMEIRLLPLSQWEPDSRNSVVSPIRFPEFEIL